MLVFCSILTISVGAGMQTDTIRLGKQRIDIHYGPNLDGPERQRLYRWLQRVSDALLTVYGAWPQDHFAIKIERSADNTSPVPWGQVSRDDPTSVLLRVNPDFASAALIHDWTAFHELSHLLIPYRGYGNLWFSEGLASYYQNIIQARSGLLSEAQLWAKIAAGFTRGRQQNKWSGVNLTELSGNIRRYRSFMRMHWSGVHYWLTADMTLRRQSHNKKSLDSVLQQLKQCCSNRSMSAKAIAQKLDQLSGATIFTPLFDKYGASHAIPDYRPTLTALGIFQDTKGPSVSLKTDAPYADIRQSIYRGKVD